MKVNKKSIIINVLRIFVFLIGLSVLLYPTISNYLYEKNSSEVVSSYNDVVVKLNEEQKNKMFQDAREYNKDLLSNVELLDPFSPVKNEVDERYENLLNVNGVGMMGYIKIPAINVQLPIYHGTLEKVLQEGVGHFEGTSLPVGGESTHTVLTAHRGLPSKELFTNLDKLKENDIFYINILGETLAYKINQILTVLPEDTKELQIVNEKDYATLVTCTPYAINTHRLLLRGERIPYEDAVKIVPNLEQNVKIPFEIKVLIIALLAILVILIILLIVKIARRKSKNDKK